MYFIDAITCDVILWCIGFTIYSVCMLVIFRRCTCIGFVLTIYYSCLLSKM